MRTVTCGTGRLQCSSQGMKPPMCTRRSPPLKATPSPYSTSTGTMRRSAVMPRGMIAATVRRSPSGTPGADGLARGAISASHPQTRPRSTPGSGTSGAPNKSPAASAMSTSAGSATRRSIGISGPTSARAGPCIRTCVAPGAAPQALRALRQSRAARRETAHARPPSSRHGAASATGKPIPSLVPRGTTTAY
jgi:hypothetical protein